MEPFGQFFIINRAAFEDAGLDPDMDLGGHGDLIAIWKQLQEAGYIPYLPQHPVVIAAHLTIHPIMADSVIEVASLPFDWRVPGGRMRDGAQREEIIRAFSQNELLTANDPRAVAFWRYAKEMAGYYAAGRSSSSWWWASSTGPSFPLWFWTYRRAAVAVIGYLVNTTVNGVITLVAVLVLSSFTGYIFARLKFPGKEILFYMIFSLLMIPSILTLVPQFMIVKGLGLLNTRWVLILPWTAIHQVLGIFLMRTYLEVVDAPRLSPEEVQKRISGATETTASTESEED